MAQPTIIKNLGVNGEWQIKLKHCPADLIIFWIRAVFFNLSWFAAPFGSLKKFGGTTNCLKMTIWQHLM
jgi:hypothetical protein